MSAIPLSLLHATRVRLPVESGTGVYHFSRACMRFPESESTDDFIALAPALRPFLKAAVRELTIYVLLRYAEKNLRRDGLKDAGQRRGIRRKHRHSDRRVRIERGTRGIVGGLSEEIHSSRLVGDGRA